MVKKEKEAANPKEEYERLLKEEVKSTRTSWTDFRRTWKKDRRFFGWGRDDREREKRFRDFVRDLGESECTYCDVILGTNMGLPEKRAAAQKAEADFFTLLREHKDLVTGSIWKDVSFDRTLYSPFVAYLCIRSSGNLSMILVMMPLGPPLYEKSSSIPF